jgi:hypothetical protein
MIAFFSYTTNHSPIGGPFSTASFRLSLSQILQILSVNVFEQVSLVELVAKTASQNNVSDYRNQLILNGF